MATMVLIRGCVACHRFIFTLTVVNWRNFIWACIQNSLKINRYNIFLEYLNPTFGLNKKNACGREWKRKCSASQGQYFYWRSLSIPCLCLVCSYYSQMPHNFLIAQSVTCNWSRVLTLPVINPNCKSIFGLPVCMLVDNFIFWPCRPVLTY